MAHYGTRVADYIEKHTNAIASDIRDAIDSATWIPDSMRPPRAQEHHFFARAPPPPQGAVARATAWISKNRTAVAVVIAFAGTTAYLIYRRKKAHSRKRRAKRFANGTKKEIVVLSCSSFHEPLTRSLALNLERRGYVVFVTVSSTEEDSLVHAESKPDIRPLWIDLTSTVPNPNVDIHPNLEPIRELIAPLSRSPSPGAGRVYAPIQPSKGFNLAGIVILPGSSGYPSGPLATLPPSDVVDTINTRVLAPILTVQQFLPLLANNSREAKSPAAIILAYPSISRSLTPPNAIAEIVASSALSSLVSSLRREVHMSGTNLTLTELKMGNFDLGSTPSQPVEEGQGQSSALTHWHSSQRAAAQRSRLGQSSLIKGSSAREFHNAVFDALTPPPTFKAFGIYQWRGRSRRSTVYVGSGARLYDIVGRVMPAGLVGWMMGYKRNPQFTGFGNKLGSTPSAKPPAPNVWGGGSANDESGIWEKV